jgi:ribosome modulation factor
MSSLKSTTTQSIEAHGAGWQSFFHGELRSTCPPGQVFVENQWYQGWDAAHRAAIETHKLSVYRDSLLELIDMGEPLARNLLRQKKPPQNLKHQAGEYLTLADRLRDALKDDAP